MRDHRNADEQHERVAQKNHDARKQVALARDVALARLQNVPRQREVERIGRAEQQMEPRDVTGPVPDKIPDHKQQHQQHRVERKKIRRQRDDEVILRHDDVAAFGSCFELLYFAAEKPGPDGMR